MGNKCAFCANENISFTKEHIYPKCLYDRTPEQDNTYISNINKVVGSEITINDVCSNCNNVKLSKLDSYFCELYYRSLKYFVYRDEIVDFEYDFDSLARWILKVSYNSARATKTNFEFLSKFTDYMLSNINRPDNFSLLIQLIIPYKMTDRQFASFPRANEVKTKYILPFSTRTGEFELQIRGNKHKLGRVFSINSYYFYMLFQPKEIPERLWKKFISNIDKIIPGATKLKITKKKVVLRASKINSLEANQDFIKEANVSIFGMEIKIRKIII